MEAEVSAYFAPAAGLPLSSALITSKVIVRDTYAIIPAASIMDSVCSHLPGWRQARCWVLAAPAIGAATGFVQYLVYLEATGGCARPEEEPGVESFLFVLEGAIEVTVDGERSPLGPGGFAFVPPDSTWSIGNAGAATAKFVWLRKLFEPHGDLRPRALIGHEATVAPAISKTTSNKWTTHLLPADDRGYDMNMNIVTFGPGTNIPFVEAHIMEHGLYMLEGRGLYLLNEHWHEVEAGDFIWMRAFCPQAFQASGEAPARYLLYKNVNRQIRLRPGA
jgi:(S)-ureidoglycine aminohydrolase